MSEDRPTLESRIEDLTARLAELEQRLAEVERRVIGGAAAESVAGQAAVGAQETAPSQAVPTKGTSQEIVPLIGRTLVVLGGAFALRAVTEAGILPRVAGTVLGIGYAILWIVLADRAAAKQRWSGAGFHALAAAIIAYPLLWEATVKFGFLSPAASALALAAVTGLALVVAARRDQRTMAWVFTVAATATALALALATKMLVMFVALLLLLGLATLCLGYMRGWRSLAWFVAVVVDLAVLMLTTIVIVGGGERVQEVIRPGQLLILQLALVLIYLGTFYTRTLLFHESVAAPAILQGTAVLVAGIGGAIAVAQTTDVSAIPLGAVSLTLAVGSYAASFTFIDRSLERRESFIFYSSLALVFTLVGFGVLLDGAARGLAFALVGLVAAWLGGLRHRATLSLHGAVYIVAAAMGVGLFRSAWNTFVGPLLADAAWVTLPAVAVIAVAAAACWIPVATHGKTWGRFSRVPKLVVLLVVLAGIGGIAVTWGARLLPTDASGTDTAALSTLRTSVLALSAILLAVVGRWKRLPEAAWMVYPLLLAGGLKLLLEDVRVGRPVTLFISFALYGGALIVAPRLARRRP